VAAAGLDGDAETVRDLYAVAAQGWVDSGHPVHYVLVPASDSALVDAFFRLGFGLQHVHAARVPAPAPAAPSGVVVRRARREDVPVLGRLDRELPLHQGRSPVFSSGHLPTEEEAVQEWDEGFDDERFATFVAEVDGEVVGSAVGCALEVSSSHAGPARLDDAGFLGFAAVLPGARGHGAGRALGEAVIGWSYEQGHRSVVTDWRATNLLSSRTWPKLGFEPTFLRLHRVVGY
jgi:GNAT superfamily N-acetyltransferase